MAMESFAGKLAVVTGGGSGMGRELTRQLAAQGCSVAACDLNPDTMAETVALAQAEAPPSVRVTGHICDVADEAQVLRFRDDLLAEHASDHTNIVRNSFIAQGLPAPEHMSDAQAEEMVPPGVRDALAQAGTMPAEPTGEDLRRFLVQASADFRDKAAVSAAQAATIILDGVRAGTWRILIGQDATMIDERVRAKPEAAYDYAELFAGLIPDSGDQAS